MEQHLCPTCQQTLPMTKVDVIDIDKAVDADKLTADDAFKRTYLGHGKQSSVFVFQGHAGPFKKHVHITHDEVGYVLKGSGSVTVGETTRSRMPIRREAVGSSETARLTAAASGSRCLGSTASATSTTPAGSSSRRETL